MIKNFQSHKNTEINFDDNLNIIIGTSDSGKSSIIRAFRWVIENRPSGEAFRSWWGGDTVITIETTEGCLSRIRTDKKNLYKLNGNEFKAINQDVPDEVKQFLNLSNINLQQQAEQFFLIDETPGQVARYFNEIAGLEKIDTSISNVKRWVRELEQNKKYKKQEITKLQEEIKQFDYLDDMEQEVIKLEELEHGKNKNIKDYNEIIEVIEDIEKIEEEINQFKDVLKAEKEINGILLLYKEVGTIHGKLTGVSTVIHNIEKVKKEIEENNKIVKAEKEIKELLQLIDTVEDKEEERIELIKITGNLEETNNRIKEKNNFILKKEKQFKKQFPKICPICGASEKYQKL